MRHFLTEYPVADISKIGAEDRVRYCAGLVKVASSDGLDEKERQAVHDLAGNIGLTAADIDRAEEMAGEKDFGELFGHSTVMEIFAPFLIRDSMIISAADGVLSDEEVASAIREGKQLGIKEEKIRRIAKAIRLSMEALLVWKKAIQ
jgi:uncharacterized tellurite resistance protein B-like protein